MDAYDAVVFDKDGVLVELTDLEVLREATRAAFADLGVTDPDERFVELAVDEELDELRAIEGSYDLTVEEYWAARERRAIDRQRAAIRDGGKPLFEDVASLSDLSHQLGIVSNNQQATVEFVVEYYGLEGLFETVYGREPTYAGARRRKPDPHYLEAALDDLGTRDALYVGDSPKDVAVAHRAGVDAAYLRRPHRETVTPEREPVCRVSDLAELVDLLDGDRVSNR